jgi:ferric-dicitrate binding protein FerR (iron transport regulator)
MRQIVLPDSTIVQLNAGTSLKFPVQFSDKKREVFLLDGEAFFDVKHNAAKPFLVHTANVTTQVLGTSFNIKYYMELPDIQVFVNSGKVEVHDQKHTLGMYTPHQQLTYNKQNESFIKQQVADEHSLSWMHDELILNDVSFKEVTVYLQNRYSVNFKYSSKKLNQQHYSVRFSNKLTINQVIDILQLIDGRKYRLNGNTVNIN